MLHLGGTKVLGVLLTMDAQQGVDLLDLLQPRQALPVHYDDYGLMKSPLADFRRRGRTTTTPGRRELPAPGRHLHLPRSLAFVRSLIGSADQALSV